MHELTFSLPFLSVSHVEGESLSVYAPTIIFNAGSQDVPVGSTSLTSLHSTLVKNAEFPSVENVILLHAAEGYGVQNHHPHREEMMHAWTHVHDIFPLPHLQNTALWRSDKQTVGKFTYNLWFAAEGTHCGLHNKHDFKEVHTQLFGRGYMQKFHGNDPSLRYENVQMEPGYTHEPFYNENGEYPWHQYYAETDCVWLAVEFA